MSSESSPTSQSGTPSTAARLLVGTKLGNYQLISVLGSGGMATVWVARRLGHEGLRRFVAIKVARESLAADDNFRNMFIDEARVASSIQHPNVCSALDLGEAEGQLFIAMEWMAGSLRDLLRKMPTRRLEPAVAARIIADACAGLHAAHELCDIRGNPREVVHRDVSPDNLLFTVEGRVKVTDFGVARARDQMHAETKTGELKGKLSFMAPEQFYTKTYDRRVDVYAIGCVLYGAVVGRRPFKGSDAEILYDILESKFARPREVIPQLPESFEALILRAMAKRPEDRFETADAMRIALEDWITTSGEAGSAGEVATFVRGTFTPDLVERVERVEAAAAALDGLARRAAPAGPHDSGAPTQIHNVAATIDVEVGDDSAANAVKSASSSSRPRYPWMGGAAALVLVLLVGGGVAVSRVRPVPAVTPPSSTSTAETTSEADEAGASPGIRDTIRVTAQATPGGAMISIDNGAPVAAPFQGDFPRDGVTHTIRATAPDCEPEVLSITFDSSQNLVFHLRSSHVTVKAGNPRDVVRLPGSGRPPVPVVPVPTIPTIATADVKANPTSVPAPSASVRKKRPIDPIFGD